MVRWASCNYNTAVRSSCIANHHLGETTTGPAGFVDDGREDLLQTHHLTPHLPVPAPLDLGQGCTGSTLDDHPLGAESLLQ